MNSFDIIKSVRLTEKGTTQADKFLADYETTQTAKADAILAKRRWMLDRSGAP